MARVRCGRLHREWATGGTVVLVLMALTQFWHGRFPAFPATLNFSAEIQHSVQQDPDHPSAWRRQALEQDHWEGVPDISLAMALPSWAGCPRPPCQYGQIADGAVNVSVSSRPPHSRRGTHRLTA